MDKKQINDNEEGKRWEDEEEQRRHENDKRKAEKLRKAESVGEKSEPTKQRGERTSIGKEERSSQKNVCRK